MPEILSVTVYQIDELSVAAREKARFWYRDTLNSFSWWDAVYEDFLRICAIIGVDVATVSRRSAGPSSVCDPCVYFRGVSSQGDGASFEGVYKYARRAVHEIRQYAPQDEALHAIADQLTVLQRQNFYQLIARITQRGLYYHEYTMRIDVTRDSPSGQDMTAEAEEGIIEALRDLARWLYRSLEREWDYQTTDGAIDDAIRANGYTFTVGGDRFS
ncbi:antitoxin of toxin-antitoxin stability system [Komagataeibacter nataicola]|uniref:antitoxin of toxin-antitoxin stability system n=1 Tax=Komagataeibacter nataicola TaxID=265960 RepID=UPI0023DD15E0|nr:antitoxin of toxin-antitoxin stability system [Komagataeibacter nataicola]WEQ55002.1 antitoxin of toxin-antitoxin stability system [Komagataeibacter nataicola]